VPEEIAPRRWGVATCTTAADDLGTPLRVDPERLRLSWFYGIKDEALTKKPGRTAIWSRSR